MSTDPGLMSISPSPLAARTAMPHAPRRANIPHLPNFLIIGAAKSGTTSLFRYLGQHPDVFASRVKEPGFFAFEGQNVRFRGQGDESRNRSAVTRLEDYQTLFRDVQSESAVGEASVVYLYDENAPQRIQSYISNARLIVVLRNPVERAFSNYLHLVRDGRELLPTFASALSAEEERMADNWQYLWHYRRLGCYADQLQRYFDLFSPGQIAVVTHDDFSRDPVKVSQSLFRFLNVDDRFQPDTTMKYNVAGSPRFQPVHDFLKRPNPVKKLLRRFVPPNLRQRVWRWTLKANIEEVKQRLPDDVRRELTDYYREDVRRLESMLDRDLSTWKA